MIHPEDIVAQIGVVDRMKEHEGRWAEVASRDEGPRREDHCAMNAVSFRCAQRNADATRDLTHRVESHGNEPEPGRDDEGCEERGGKRRPLPLRRLSVSALGPREAIGEISGPDNREDQERESQLERVDRTEGIDSPVSLKEHQE